MTMAEAAVVAKVPSRKIRLDDAIREVLPPGTEVAGVEHVVKRDGHTSWSLGYKIYGTVAGQPRAFYVKIFNNPHYAGMAESEFEAHKTLHTLIPCHSPAPIGWGYLRAHPANTFYLTYYEHLYHGPRPVSTVLDIIHYLHKRSASPTGMFGFHTRCYYGPMRMVVDWTDNWELFWTREFRSNLEFASGAHGRDSELLDLAGEFIEKVIPRLLRPLQTGGRSIRPVLCHGNLWDGNIEMESTGFQPLFLGACPFYGHMEMDLQGFRSSRYALGSYLIDEYRREFEVSEPKEDFYDRNLLYSVRNDIMAGSMWPQWGILIEEAKHTMTHLIAKHGDGIDGFKGDLTPSAYPTGPPRRPFYPYEQQHQQPYNQRRPNQYQHQLHRKQRRQQVRRQNYQRVLEEHYEKYCEQYEY